MALEPYSVIFPDKDGSAMTLVVERRLGSIPKGSYGYIDCYCTDRGCDCRRVTIIVLNDKMKEKAVISFGFDPDGPMAGPFLDDFHRQAPYAGELLEQFVQMINDNPDWLEMMYERYRSVRRKVDGKSYRGKPFPRPGTVERRVIRPPDLESELEEIMRELVPSPKGRQAGRGKRGARTADGEAPRAAEGARPAGGLGSFVERYAQLGRDGVYTEHEQVRNGLRRYLQAHPEAGEEMAGLLAALPPLSEEEEERIDAALRLLYEMLELLREDVERQRQGAEQRMEELQQALARRVYEESGDTDLCAAVTHTLLQSRVEILPALSDANSRRMMSEGAATLAAGMPQGDVMAGLYAGIEGMGITSPSEGLEALLQLLALSHPEIQIALCGEMLGAAPPFIRDTAALMLFHPNHEVRLGVSEKLAEMDASSITPETLRRLIVSRNWFPEIIRGNIDRAIARARKARVECAPLPKRPPMTVHASTIDGAGAQSFQVVIPDARRFYSCSILLKRGVGVADAFVVSIQSKRELKKFLAVMEGESFLESTVDHLDLRVCQALAEGARCGNAPNYWLAHIAELLGRDQWKAVPLDAAEELASLRRELENRRPQLLTDRVRGEAIDQSGDWLLWHLFAQSWFEDDATVDREIEAAMGRKKRSDSWGAVCRIVDNVLRERRSDWLERLVLATLWLKSVAKPPLPWHLMFHVAEAVGDQTVPLREIPLMVGIAEQSFAAYLARS